MGRLVILRISQQVLGRGCFLECIDHYNAIAANNESGIAARMAAIGSNRRVHAVPNFLNGKVGFRRQGQG